MFLLLPAMFLLPHSSQQGFHLLQIPALLSTSSPGATCYDQKVQEYGNERLWHTGWEYKFSIPITGTSFFVQAHSKTCSNCLLGIRTFTPGDRSTWHPGDAVRYPAVSYLQRRWRNGFFTLICVGLQRLHETLGWSLPKSGFRFLANTSPRCQNTSDCVFNLKHCVVSSQHY